MLEKSKSVPTSNPFESYFDPLALRLLYIDKGRKSPAVGRDGIRREKFELSLEAESDLISRKSLDNSYNFTRYKERLISKGYRKFPRQISIPTIRDRLTLRALNDYLARQAPKAKSELPHQPIREIASAITSCGPHHSFVRIDVKEFFPSIDHKHLSVALKSIMLDPRATDLIFKALKNPTGGKAAPKVEEIKGVPQGLSISNILSSIYLADFDAHLKKKYVHYWRYVDDILVICPSQSASSIFNDIVIQLNKLNLEAHPLQEGGGKCDIVRMGKGIDYLGYNLSSQKIKVRKSSYDRMFSNLMKVFTSFKYSKNKEKFLLKLNLKITECVYEGKRKGWLFFFSQTEDMSQLLWLDNFVDSMRRKHASSIDRSRISKFTRTYHEIRYNFSDSKYFPNFDNFTDDEKLDFISLMTRFTKTELLAMDPQEFDELFSRTVDREVSVLEEDIQDTFS